MPSRAEPRDDLAPYRALLARPHVSLISAEPDLELDWIAATIAGSIRISGRADLEVVLDRLLEASADTPIAPKTLDLLGHSTAVGAQLRLGAWVLDPALPAVAAWCRVLGERAVLPRLGVEAVRLLGCRTAEAGPARATLLRLAELLRIDVFGTEHLLYRAHYDALGFREPWQFLLVSARELQRVAHQAAIVTDASPSPRTLDLAALPALPLGAPPPWSRGLATPAITRRILQLIRRDAGGQMPGRLTPCYELALPAGDPDLFHVAHVLLEGAFLRFYPDGPDAPGVVYPVDDARALLQITGALSPSAR